jgi:hypothetical protein
MTDIVIPAAASSALPDHVHAWALMGVLRDGTAGYLLGRFRIARHDPERPRAPGHPQRSSDEHQL